VLRKNVYIKDYFYENHIFIIFIQNSSKMVHLLLHPFMLRKYSLDNAPALLKIISSNHDASVKKNIMDTEWKLLNACFVLIQLMNSNRIIKPLKSHSLLFQCAGFFVKASFQGLATFLSKCRAIGGAPEL